MIHRIKFYTLLQIHSMVFLTSAAEMALLDIKQFTDNMMLNQIHNICTFEHQCSTSLV